MSTLAAACLAIFGCFRLTDAPNIAGNWQGESWQQKELEPVQEAGDWYSGRFVDSEGKTGALQLEWSAVKRQYDGRWSIGSERSGTIVLRTATRNQVRGAILFDSNVRTKANEMRLRDFLWAPSDQPFKASGDRYIESKASNDVAKKEATPNNVRLIASPMAGTIKKISPSIYEGRLIKKGDVVAEIRGNIDTALLDQLKVTKVELKTLEIKAGADEQNVKAYVEASDFTVASLEEIANAAQSKLKAQKNLLQGYEAKVRQAKLDYERGKKLFENALIPDKQLSEAKKDWDVAGSDLAAAEIVVATLESEWMAKKQEIEEKKRLAQPKINTAKALYEDALAKIATMRKDIAELESKQQKILSVLVRSPIDGFLVSA